MGIEGDLLRTPDEKAAHVAANFGVDSIYAKVWRVIAAIYNDTLDFKMAVSAGETLGAFLVSQKESNKEIDKPNSQS